MVGVLCHMPRDGEVNKMFFLPPYFFQTSFLMRLLSPKNIVFGLFYRTEQALVSLGNIMPLHMLNLLAAVVAKRIGTYWVQ